jgi:hypothetical protein
MQTTATSQPSQPSSSANPAAAQIDHLLLRRTLTINAIVSAVSGAGTLLFAQPLATFMGIAQPAVLVVLSVVMLAFAAFAWLTRTETPLKRLNAWLIFWGDEVWVLGGLLVVFADVGRLTDGGKIVVLVTVLIVADFALFEWIGLRRGKAPASA